MKLTIILLTAFLFTAKANSIAQNVSFSGTGVPLEKVFSAVEKQTGYYFLYTKQILMKGKPVSIDVKDMPLIDFLSKLFESQPLAYTVASKTITISAPVSFIAMADKGDSARHVPNAVISGIIIDEEGLPLAGATVAVKGTNKGTSAGSDGRFSLSGIDEKATLEVSAIGFKAVTLKIVDNSVVQFTANGKVKEKSFDGGLQNVIIRLQKSSSPLDETVVIAYGSTTKRLNTGSVSTVKAEEIEKQPVMNLQQALQGRVPGLEISITNGNSMAPVKMEIRGRNSLNPNMLSEPLYVIDGVPYNVLNVNTVPGIMQQEPSETSYGMSQAGMSNTNGQNILSFLNPRDIESVDVLKDADATAIYGSRGSNGVIMITTKRGKAGPTRFNLSIEQGTLLIPKRLNVMSTEEYLNVRREAFVNDGVIPTPENAIDLKVWDQNRYTDWQKVLYGTGTHTQISAGVSGGLNQTTYKINASYSARKELMNNSGKNSNAGLAMSIDHRSANQKFNVGLKTLLSLVNANAFSIGGGATVPPNAPPIYNESGELNFEEWRSGSTYYYPFAGLKTGSTETGQAVNASMDIGYQVLKGLRISASAGYSFGNNSGEKFNPLSSYPPNNPFAVATAFYGTTTNNVWSIEPQITYNTYVGRGKLDFLAGSALQINSTKGTTLYGAGYPDDNLINSINNAMQVVGLEGYAEHKYVAAFARLTYNWANKYILSLNGRRDGSSRFGSGKQFGNFGSVGLAWIVSEEQWLQDALPDWVSFLKLRGSYGTTGGNNVGDYQYLSRWSINSDPYGTAKWSPYGGVPAILIKQPINQQFQWESTAKMDAALEMGFLKDMVNFTAGYYRNRSGNQLTSIPTPAYTGFESVVANWDALVQNSGFEFSGASRFINTKNFSLSARIVFSINKNKLLEYPNIERSPYASRYQVGKSLNSRYYLHYIGVDPVDGTYLFEDRNKDGVIAAYAPFIPGDADADKYVPIDLTPKYSGGFGFQVAYKQFDVDMYFMYRKQLGKNPFTTLSVGSMKNLILPDEVKNNHWQNVGDIVLYPKYTGFFLGPIEESDGAFTDASFVKLASLAISYELPKKLIEKINMRSCRISVKTQDLFYITSYGGPNPELQSFERVSPIPRTIATSLLIEF